MAFTVEVKDDAFKKLTNMLRDMPKKIPKETAIAINKTANQHGKAIAKQIRKYIHIDVRGSKDAVSIIQRAKPANMKAIVHIAKGFRPSLKRFKARQTAAGVKYKISKMGGGGFVPGAFGPNIANLGNHVFKRVGTGLVKLKGPSVWGVYVKQKFENWTDEQVNEQLNKELDKRIKFLIFKAERKAGLKK